MNYFKLILLSLLFLYACNSKPSATVQTDSVAAPDTAGIENPDTLSQAMPAEQVAALLYSSEKLHIFSDAARKDTFRISVQGKDFENAMVRFEIITFDGRVIYNDSFEGSYLIDYGILDEMKARGSVNAEMRSAYIKKRLKSFFDEKNFIQPAIKKDAKDDGYYPDKALFDEIKANPKSVAFRYLLGKEDGKWIAYSASRAEAAIFYNCC